MTLIRTKVVEAATVVAGLAVVALAGWGSANLGLWLAGVLHGFPTLTIVVLVVLCLVPIIYGLPIVGGVLAIIATGYGLTMRLPVIWAVIVTAILWWFIANLIGAWSKPPSGVGGVDYRRLLTLWRHLTWWESQILGYLCPAVAVCGLLLFVSR